MTKTKLIHVGLGRWGFDWAQHVYPGSFEVEPVAYVDRDPQALGAARSKLGPSSSKFFPTLSEAIAATDAEAVTIALLLPLHAAVAREALLAGKHVRMSIRRLNSEPEEIDLQPMPKYDRLGVLNAFALAIRNGIPPSFFPSGRDNLSTLSIVEAAIRSSSQDGASVQIGTFH